MKRHHYLMAALVPALLFLATSCGTIHSMFRAKPADVSDFLPHHERLERMPDDFPCHYLWAVDYEIESPKYIRIAPVDTSYLRQASGWNALESKLGGDLQDGINDLAVFMQKRFYDEFSKYVVEGKTPLMTEDPNEKDCLVIEMAIVALVPTAAALNIASQVGGIFVPGLSVLTSPLAEGSISIEYRVRDARNGKIVAMYATTESDPVAVFSLAKYSWMGSAYYNVDMLAKKTVECWLAGEKYREVKHEFPIRFTDL